MVIISPSSVLSGIADKMGMRLEGLCQEIHARGGDVGASHVYKGEGGTARTQGKNSFGASVIGGQVWAWADLDGCHILLQEDTGVVKSWLGFLLIYYSILQTRV